MKLHHVRNLNWDRVIVALVQHRSVPKAAAALGMHRVTVWRYLKTPEFYSDLVRALALVSSEARARLEAQSCAAADLINQIMRDPTESTANRMKAARYILDHPPTRLSLDDLRLEDFEPDSQGLDPGIPTAAELHWEDQTSETGRMTESGEELEKIRAEGSPEERAALMKVLEDVVARRQASAGAPKTSATGPDARSDNTSRPALEAAVAARKESASPNAPRTAPASGPDVSSGSMSNTALHHSTEPETPAGSSGAELNHSPNAGTPTRSSADLNHSANPGTVAGPGADPNPLPNRTRSAVTTVQPNPSPNRRIEAECAEAQRQARESIRKVLESDHAQQRR